MRAQIRERVTGDIWRVGVGAGLILIFIPLFILAIISKFFIDRSRASQRLAELKRKEAEFHRMSQQVTEAKLSALQAQVEPHFLYNTLATVQALTEVDPQQANADDRPPDPVPAQRAAEDARRRSRRWARRSSWCART